MTKKKRILSVIMAVALVASMMFAMNTVAFASTTDDVTVTVAFDTRSYDLNAKMIKTNGSLVSSSPVVEYTVSVSEGSTALKLCRKRQQRIVLK